LRKKSIPGIWKWESKIKLSGKESILAQSGRKHWKTSIRLSEKNQTVDIQFGDGPKITLGFDDGAIRPQEEVGIGPEVAAIVSSLVVKGNPSGDDEHVERLFETVPSGVRERGISYPSETVPQVLGSDSLRLAQSGHNRKGSRTFRKRTQKRSGLDQPKHSEMKWGEDFWKKGRKNVPKKGRCFVQRQIKRQKSQKSTEHISDQQDHHIEQQSLFEGLDQPDRQSDLSKGAGCKLHATSPESKRCGNQATLPTATTGPVEGDVGVELPYRREGAGKQQATLPKSERRGVKDHTIPATEPEDKQQRRKKINRKIAWRQKRRLSEKYLSEKRKRQKTWGIKDLPDDPPNMSTADTRINMLPLSQERTRLSEKKEQSPLDIFMAQQVWETPGTLHTPDTTPQLSEDLKAEILKIVEGAEALKKSQSELKAHPQDQRIGRAFGT
jgi:hypothetical protein